MSFNGRVVGGKSIKFSHHNSVELRPSFAVSSTTELVVPKPFLRIRSKKSEEANESNEIDQLIRRQISDEYQTILNARPNAVFVPLHVFDNTEFEIVEKVAEQQNLACMALVSLRSNEMFAWKSALAREYNSSTNRWLVCSAAGNSEFDEQWIERLRICFSVEDAQNSCDRFCWAVKLKRMAEKMIGRLICLEQQQPLAETTINCIDRIARVLRSKRSKSELSRVDSELELKILKSTFAYWSKLLLSPTKKLNLSTNFHYPATGERFGIDMSEKITNFARTTTINKAAFREIMRIVVENMNDLENAMKIVNFIDIRQHLSLDDLRERMNINSVKARSYMIDVWRKRVIDRISHVLKSSRYFQSSLELRDVESLRRSPQTNLLRVTRAIIESNLIKLFERDCDDLIKLVDERSFCSLPNCKPLIVQTIKLNGAKLEPEKNIDVIVSEINQLLFGSISFLNEVPHIEKEVLCNLRYVIPHYYDISSNVQQYIDGVMAVVSERLKPFYHELADFENKCRNVLEFAETDVQKFMGGLSSESDINELKTTIEALVAKRREIDCLFRFNSIQKGIMRGSILDVKLQLSDNISAVIEEMVKKFSEALNVELEEAYLSIDSLKKTIISKPGNIEEIYETREKLINGIDKAKSAALEIQGLLPYVETFCVAGFPIPSEIRNILCDGYSMRFILQKVTPLCLQNLYKEANALKINHAKVSLEITARINALKEDISMIQSERSVSQAYEMTVLCTTIDDEMIELEKSIATAQKREFLYKLPINNYVDFAEIRAGYEPYRNVWICFAKWEQILSDWNNVPIYEFDPNELQVVLDQNYTDVCSFISLISEDNDFMKSCKKVKAEMESLMPYLKMAHLLNAIGSKDSNWEKLSELTGIKVKKDRSLTGDKCVQLGLHTKIDNLNTIAELVENDQIISNLLQKLNAFYDVCLIEIRKLDEHNIYRFSDELIAFTDDNVVQVQSLLFFPADEALKQTLNGWFKKLKMLQESIEEWVACQRLFMYLEPLFRSVDIQQQLPEETRNFLSASRLWARIARLVDENELNAVKICSHSRLKSSLKEAQKLMDSIHRGLIKYLEGKRVIFPRFYFLSDDELLQLLVHANDPIAVQDYLYKCFENVMKIKFEEDSRISAIISGEGESVDLVNELYPSPIVENWMQSLEINMVDSLKKSAQDTLADSKTAEKNEWIFKWPGQLIIAVSQLLWTASTSSGIELSKLNECYLTQIESINYLKQLISQPMTAAHRETLKALIVIEVHARDVLASLVNEKIDCLDAFDWISQMRYYLINGNLNVKMIDASFNYGYEYLGNSSRLVITPLTDRCYLTLISALHLKFGGAPSGPAGTGKTETTKDLAKALAMKCVVFNCSDQMDFHSMGMFFRGLASSGSWACFDEFNRINVEVLSVIATQIATIQLALRNEMEQFYFEGVNTKLRPSCAVFVTMNPGYAGRTELPDNLKILFRPVAMMIPDYCLIAEISMISFGFEMAAELSRKIVHSFKLASEQLSDQNHYDFGMRAVKAVISAAGNLKHQFPTDNEEALCLKAINDVNTPKFLSNDLKLFSDILSDIFPYVRAKDVDEKSFIDFVRQKCGDYGLNSVSDAFIEKCSQIYGTTIVRHGLMVVGKSNTGKSMALKITKDALTCLASSTDKNGFPIELHIVNPKALDMGHLFGFYDENTREWTDGVFPFLMRRYRSSSDKRIGHWFVMDGPVDPDWIENLNTVLDDNKKLCLANAETIKLNEDMRMIFEVNDLSKVSPATVSRCGMIYFDDEVVPLDLIVQCWLDSFNEEDSWQNLKDHVEQMIEDYLKPMLYFIEKSQKTMIDSSKKTDFQRFVKLFGCVIDRLFSIQTKIDKSQFSAIVESYFVFCVIWMAGGIGKPSFHEEIDGFVRIWRLNTPIPRNGTVFDYYIDESNFQWRKWTQSRGFNLSIENADFGKIRIPTIETVRLQYWLNYLLKKDCPIMLVGETGTAKTTIVQNLIESGPQNVWGSISLSSETPLNLFQEFLEQKLDKRKKNTYGPPLGRKMVFFIDDLNMPRPDKYGSQPLMELLRQFLDHGGWYDKSNIGDFRKIEDSNLICAMQPPTGTSSSSLSRMVRHFNTFACPEFSEKSMIRIYSALYTNWMNREKEPNQVLVQYLDHIVNMSVSLYSAISKNLLPLPSKPQYRYNLRDLTKIFQGINMHDPARIKTFARLFDLWTHESCRVLKDRLSEENDRDLFNQLFEKTSDKFVSERFSGSIWNHRSIYCDFAGESDSYERVTNMEKIEERLENFQIDYNTSNNQNWRIVFFEYAIDHLMRIARILRQESSNALLIGMAGNGRKTLTTIAAHITANELIRIQPHKAFSIQEWKDSLKAVLLKCGLQNTKTVLLFDASELSEDYYFEDISCLLTSGDIINLYSSGDLENILEKSKRLLKTRLNEPSKANIFAAYLDNIKKHLHIVLCMSPVNKNFLERIRQFPAIVNLCTIDYYDAWSDKDLASIGSWSLEPAYSILNNSQIVAETAKLMAKIHRDCFEMAEQMTHRTHYVPSAKYLEFMDVFTSYIERRLNVLTEKGERAAFGIKKLKQAQESAVQTERSLKHLLPALASSSERTRTMMDLLEKERKDVEEDKEKLKEEEAEIFLTEKAVTERANAAKKELKKIAPMIEQVKKSLNVLSSNDINELSTMKSPPIVVAMVMRAVCILVESTFAKPKKAAAGEWQKAQAFLRDANFLKNLKNFDKDNVSESTIAKLEWFVKDPKFKPSVVRKSSKACESLATWVHAIYQYYFVHQEVLPKQIKVKMAVDELNGVKEFLAEKKMNLKQLEDQLDALARKLQETIEEKDSIERSVEESNKKMVQANRLINGLLEDKKRWAKLIDEVEMKLNCLIGDSVLIAAHVVYISGFDDATRLKLKTGWTQTIEASSLKCSEGLNFVESAGNQAIIRNWHMSFLPTDEVSVENALISTMSTHWPLFIDPQGRAVKWIQNMERDRQLVSFKYSDQDYSRKLESCMRQGQHCLLMDVPDQIDSALDCVLAKKVVLQAGWPMIKIGNALIPYSNDFMLFMVSKSNNPNFTPELVSKCAVIDFTLSARALEEQLTSIILSIEQPEVEKCQQRLQQTSLEAMNTIESLHEKALDLISKSSNPVEDNDLIEALCVSCEKEKEIERTMAEMEITAKEIEGARTLYKPFVSFSRRVFFEIANLHKLNHMYRFSTAWFISIFKRSIKSLPENYKQEDRLAGMESNFFRLLSSNISLGLFEQDRLLLQLLLCNAKLLNENRISPMEYDSFIGLDDSEKRSAPKPESFGWLSDQIWNAIGRLEWIFTDAGITNVFEDFSDEFRTLFYTSDPYNEKLTITENLSGFRRLILVKIYRPDCFTLAIKSFLEQTLDVSYFVCDQNQSKMSRVFDEASPQRPILFILSPGCDPSNELVQHVELVKQRSRFQYISLGQGQGERAEALISRGIERGEWIYLQNCHLSPSWMSVLDEQIGSLEKRRVHRDFRLILTSAPSHDIPESILRKSVKMTVETPFGVKPNLFRSFSMLDTKQIDQTTVEVCGLRRLAFSLCLFHSVALERRRYGPIGFNIGYEFADGDLVICAKQLGSFLSRSLGAAEPLKALKVLTAEINYGGRVTDEMDRKCVKALLDKFYNQRILSDDDSYSFDTQGVYVLPKKICEWKRILEFIKRLPSETPASLLGLNENAAMLRNSHESKMISLSLALVSQKTLRIRSYSILGAETEFVRVKRILDDTPNEFGIDEIAIRFPITYADSLNTFLTQECMRYNKLIGIMRTSLTQLTKCLNGEIVMNVVMDDFLSDLRKNVIPRQWAEVSYSSTKSLSSWLIDLKDRVKFYENWIANGTPEVFWFSGFYFPQSFLTCIMQNFARANKVPIDKVALGFEILDPEQFRNIAKSGNPRDLSCLITGLFLQCASFDIEKKCLKDSEMREEFFTMPFIRLTPKVVDRNGGGGDNQEDGNVYKCPVYRTLARSGVLSTTGHSTNYVFSVDLSCGHQTPAYWMLRGTALFCTLN